MKLAVISNASCLAVAGSRYAVTEHNEDRSNQLCNEFHNVIPAQSSPWMKNSVVGECGEMNHCTGQDHKVGIGMKCRSRGIGKT